MKTVFSCALLVAGIAVLAPVPKDSPAERLADVERAIQGDWVCVRIVSKDYGFDHDLSQEKSPTRTDKFQDRKMTCVDRNDAGEITNQSECEYSFQQSPHGVILQRTKIKEIEGKDIKPLSFIVEVDKVKLTLKLYSEGGPRGGFIDPAKYTAKQLRENYKESFWHFKRR